MPWHRVLVAALTGAMVGWGLLTIYVLLDSAFLLEWNGDSLRQAGVLVLLFGLFGIPIALLIGLFLGFPMCLLAARKGWTGWRAALVIGAAAGLLYSLGSLGLQLLDGLDTSRSSHGYSYGGGEGMLWENSWPTALGWRYELQNIAITCCVGALAGLAAWRVTIRHWQPVDPA